MAHPVHQVAKLARVSVRTLHHYDAIGLLRPAERSPSGYRLYGQADLERLQAILLFRELGLPLARIREILDDPGFDRLAALEDHRNVLRQRQLRLDRLIASLERTMHAMKEGTPVKTHDLFDGFDPSRYEEEVRARWGHTEAYRESAAETKDYNQADWDEVRVQQGKILSGIAAVANLAPNDPKVISAVGRMHAFINERFYRCSKEMFRGLGDMAEDDPRFAATYEKVRPGLSTFVKKAVHAYCDQADI